MHTHQKAKDTIYFARHWLEDVLNFCHSIRGFPSSLRKNGHLDPRYISHDCDERKYRLETFLRIEINMAMYTDKKTFIEHWNQLGNRIHEFAEENGDEFNKLFQKV